MFHYQNLMTLCYLFLTSTLQIKKTEIYQFYSTLLNTQFYDKRTEKIMNRSKLRNTFLTLFFPMFPFDPPENIRKPKVF